MGLWEELNKGFVYFQYETPDKVIHINILIKDSKILVSDDLPDDLPKLEMRMQKLLQDQNEGRNINVKFLDEKDAEKLMFGK